MSNYKNSPPGYAKEVSRVSSSSMSSSTHTYLNSRSSSTNLRSSSSHLYSASSLSSMNNANSSDENLNETLIKRNNEIGRLNLKISLLEERLDSVVLNRGDRDRNERERDRLRDKDETSERLKQLDYETTLLRKEHEARKFKEKEVDKLEFLLNEREYEIQQLNQRHKEETNKLNCELIDLKTLMSQREEELISAKATSINLQRELDKSQIKVKSCEDYIKSLPTNDEVKETTKLINNLKLQNENLTSQLADSEKKILNAKHFVKEKIAKIQSLEETIEKMNASREKVEIEYQEYKNATQEVGQLIEKCEENASLKAELECAKKLLSSQQEKLKSQQAKFDDMQQDLKEKLRLEYGHSNGLRIELENKSNEIAELNLTIKNLVDEKEEAANENVSMSKKLESLETVLDADLKKLLQVLFKELTISTHDLDELKISLTSTTRVPLVAS